ncbi:MAG: hypothetical protein R2744_11545 [Bacteroidales bacterium]
MKQKDKNRDIEELSSESGFQVTRLSHRQGSGKDSAGNLRQGNSSVSTPEAKCLVFRCCFVAAAVVATSLLNNKPPQGDLPPDIIIENYSVKEPVLHPDKSSTARQT